MPPTDSKEGQVEVQRWIPGSEVVENSTPAPRKMEVSRMLESEDGDWVRYEDHCKALEEAETVAGEQIGLRQGAEYERDAANRLLVELVELGMNNESTHDAIRRAREHLEAALPLQGEGEAEDPCKCGHERAGEHGNGIVDTRCHVPGCGCKGWVGRDYDPNAVPRETAGCGGSGLVDVGGEGTPLGRPCPGCANCSCERCKGTGHDWEPGPTGEPISLGPCPDCEGTGKRQPETPGQPTDTAPNAPSVADQLPETPGLQEGGNPLEDFVQSELAEEVIERLEDRETEAKQRLAELAARRVAAGEPESKPATLAQLVAYTERRIYRDAILTLADTDLERFVFGRSTQPSPIDVAAQGG